MSRTTYAVDTDRFARCIQASKQVRWDIDADVIRGRQFDTTQKFLPDGLSHVHELGFLTPEEQRYVSQIQGRTYANIFGLVERFINAKVLELSREHWLGDQVALEGLVRFSDEELKHQALFRRIEHLAGAQMPAGYTFVPQPNDVARAVLRRFPEKMFPGSTSPQRGEARWGAEALAVGHWRTAQASVSPLQPPPAGGRPGAEPWHQGYRGGMFFCRNRLSKSTWAVLALTLDIELFTLLHYRESIDPDPQMSDLFKDVFRFHWKEESQHAIMDELEWKRHDAIVTPEQRDQAVDEFIELVGAVDSILQAQAQADASYCATTCGRTLSEAEQKALHAGILKAYRWQYIFSGAHYPPFVKVLSGLITPSQAQRQHQLAPAQARLLEMADIRPGDRVLDVACGTGLVTRRVARQVGESGTVVGVDVAGKMVAYAQHRAANQRLPQVTWARMDAEALLLPDGTFDIALCALGLMHMPHPVKALQEMYRVLHPGGRAVAAVWGRRERCGWTDIFPIVDARVTTEVCPLFFHLGTHDMLAQTFAAAGFTPIVSDRLSTRLVYASPEKACGAAFAGGPVALAYGRFDASTRAEVHADYLASIAPYRLGNRYELPGEFVIVSSQKP